MISLQVLVVAFSLVVLLHSIVAITRMDRRTNHFVRIAYILVAAGTFGEVAAIAVVAYQPGTGESLFLCGSGFLCLSDRRTSIRCPYLQNNGGNTPPPAPN